MSQKSEATAGAISNDEVGTPSAKTQSDSEIPELSLDKVGQAQKELREAQALLDQKLQHAEERFDQFTQSAKEREGWILAVVLGIAVVMVLTFFQIVADYEYNKWQAEEKIMDQLIELGAHPESDSVQIRRLERQVKRLKESIEK